MKDKKGTSSNNILTTREGKCEQKCQTKASLTLTETLKDGKRETCEGVASQEQTLKENAGTRKEKIKEPQFLWVGHQKGSLRDLSLERKWVAGWFQCDAYAQSIGLRGWLG